jgi:hypothetical protein
MPSPFLPLDRTRRHARARALRRTLLAAGALALLAGCAGFDFQFANTGYGSGSPPSVREGAPMADPFNPASPRNVWNVL